ncbi:MAG TPA: aspartate carbamoyltransferase, partial [Chloroflexota bacterium]|nr:aspartate carbamoyltransferase [Chloroflexota bacterium]
ILHSRVARSNIWGLSRMGARVTLCGPPTLMPDFGSNGHRAGLPPVEVCFDLDRCVARADVLMALRIQRERQDSGLLPSLREYVRLYQLTEERVDRARSGAMVMHPGPLNEGIEIAPEVARGTQSLIEEQVTNGVAIRMAILYLLAGDWLETAVA